MPQPAARTSLLPWDRSAAIVAGTYLAVATAWILGSDRLTEILAGNDPGIYRTVQSAKGLAFVGVTGLGLYLTLAWASARRRRLAEEKRLVEEMLAASQRLEALGTLAGTLAHDFNNTLAVIRNMVDMMKLERFEGRKTPLRVAEIERAVAHADQLIRELTLFMRSNPLAFAVGDLGAVVRGELVLLAQAASRRVTLEAAIAEKLPPVRMAPAQIARMLLNLVLNARDALEHAATQRIEIRVEPRRLDGHRSLFRPQPTSGEFVVIEVRDTGCGIPRQNLAKIFIPFFTTKPEGQGTGLGLTSTMRVMQTHHGWVEVESTEGQGTCFTLYFPVAREGAVDLFYGLH
jgi:signal transduction histidine kinase